MNETIKKLITNWTIYVYSFLFWLFVRLLVLIYFRITEYKCTQEIYNNIIVSVLPLTILTGYFLVWFGFNKDWVNNERVTIQRRTQYRKKIIQQAKISTKENYQIKEVVPTLDRSFFISFNQKVYRDALPELTLDDIPMTIQVLRPMTVVCKAKKISADKDELEIKTLSSVHTLKNHYKSAITTDKIMWQCQGHRNEKMVYISPECFPNIDKNVFYPFEIRIYKETYGPFKGVYALDQCVIFGIPNIGSENADKEAYLRPLWDKDVSILLPKPQMILVNGVLKNTF